jgi:iron complex outermembrane receptor protein
LPRTDTLEVGYKGIWGGRFLIGIDGYYTQKSEFVFNQVLSPFVGIPGETLAANLGDAVRRAFTDEELASFGLNVETLATSFAQANGALADSSIGIIEPEENYNPDTIPEMVLTSLNAGSLDYFGADLSVEATLTERWLAYANYSWVNENYFDENALGQPGSGLDVPVNAPRHKFRAGFTYKTPRGLSLSCGIRYVDSFRVVDGPNYDGVVETYTLVDAGSSYDFSFGDTRMSFALTAQNVFDHLHREYIGFPMIGRLVSSRLTCEF